MTKTETYKHDSSRELDKFIERKIRKIKTSDNYKCIVVDRNEEDPNEN